VKRITISKFGKAWLDNAGVVVAVQDEDGEEVRLEAEQDEALRISQGIDDAVSSQGPPPSHDEIEAALNRKPRYSSEQHGGG
jgi:hypothetical protein